MTPVFKICTNPLGAGTCERWNVPVDRTLGDFLREWREGMGFSQSEVADKIGVDKQSIYNIESGATKNMQPANLRRLAEVTSEPLDNLFAMVRYAKSLKATSPVQIAAPTKKKAAERAAAMNLSVDEWVSAAVEAILHLDGWKPGEKPKAK